MRKKHDFHLEYTRIINGEEFPGSYTVRNVISKQKAEEKLKRLCGDTEIIIISNEQL